MAVDYKTLVKNINGIYTDGTSAIEYINSQGLTMEEFGQLIDASDRFTAVKNAEGTILNVSEKVTSQVATESVETALNSNLSTVTSTTANIPLKVTTNAAGKVTLTQGLSSGLKFIGNTVLPAIAAASGGIMLGKAIDSALYNLNPDFWDANGMSALNPETWSSITAGEDGLSANLFNMVYGIDPETGTTQAYMDQEALAYVTAYMIAQGVFDPVITKILPTGGYTPVDPLYTTKSFTNEVNFADHSGYRYNYTLTKANCAFAFWYDSSSGYYRSILATSDLTLSGTTAIGTYAGYDWNTSGQQTPVSGTWSEYIFADNYTVNGQTFRYASKQYTRESHLYGNTSANQTLDLRFVAYLLLFGTQESSGGGIDGISDQTGATGFDASSITDPTNIAAVLAALQAQYPDLFNNAITQPVGDPLVNPDRILVPVGTPQLNPQDQTQPIADIATQLNPELDPDVYPEPDLQPWVDMILKPELEPEPEPEPDPEPNPPDTGDGITPPAVLPDGTAGALFTVYNPTQGELDSFGGWLWSSNFVDQLLKVFNDPMQAIISLHKIFATPATGNSANIYVGYLNSGVSAAKVTGQYTTVNCGSVSLPEYFGNVFDYLDTKVELYLPFVGIVSLDTGDIMRSTISVIYHIDVYTGACLADVSVTRDAGGGVLYQYAGNCAVHYPLSSGSYMGIISGLLGIAGTVASGGSAAPVLIGAGATALTAHNNIQRSGGFSANAGAMGIKKPYLIISRPQTALPDNYKHYDGIGSNSKVNIGSCNGYIKVKSLFMTSIETAYESEIDEIETLLKNGVLV